MAQNTFKKKKQENKKKKAPSFKLRFNWLKDRRLHLVFGLLLLFAAFFLLVSFVSYLFTGKADQTVVKSFYETGLKDSGLEAKNWLGLLGALVSYWFIFEWFGLASFLFLPVLIAIGVKIVFNKTFLPVFKTFVISLFFAFWISLLMGYLVIKAEEPVELGFLSGGIGYELALLFHSLMGWGTPMFLFFLLLVFAVFYFNITSLISGSDYKEEADAGRDTAQAETEEEAGLEDTFEEAEEPVEAEEDNDLEEETTGEGGQDEPYQYEEYEKGKEDPYQETLAPEELVEDQYQQGNGQEEEPKEQENEETPVGEEIGNESIELDTEVPEEEKRHQSNGSSDGEIDFQVEDRVTEQEDEANQVLQSENYDPTLDLGDYQYPSLELLDNYESGKVQVTKEELESNKNRIVETLANYKIGIASIKATIGPTVTLYEIVPEAGVRISKIKNLEDDIALSLAALGIRIIAPMPGEGTIGIEVPNKNKEMVHIRSVLSTEKFMKSDYELPVAFGKTISNEVYVLDLAKLPHLLIAGATGQGKSVGLNVLLTSLIYKKHPSQLKFVLVDPKKVELSLFNKLEKHFLATLPDSKEAIITENQQVINTLNSLCIEMDNRYDLLKDAGCRNLKEYNKKFAERRLNPEKGHRFLPYIVLVIDELADLMMTAGKEVEAPIARLAQLARAIGIHLVVATQRPSVNVITGIIKANFPARLSFKVTSKVDSRTILDIGGAEQLIGMGDMLLAKGGTELQRVQSAFVETDEVERVCEFIGEQRGYESAYQLPEYSSEEGDNPGETDLSERDSLFEDAARLIVTYQQGSTSLLQRRLKLGYNRAGRLVDQLEAAGVLGPFEGSKAREVLIQDEASLEQLLNEIREKDKQR